MCFLWDAKEMGVGHDGKQIGRVELKEISRLEVKMGYRQKKRGAKI